VYVVGERGLAMHYDGERVTEQRTGSTAMLLDVGGTSADDVWAVGGEGTILHRSDGLWRPVDSGTTTTLRAVFSAVKGEAWIGGKNALLHATAQGVESVPLPAAADIVDLHGTGRDDVWAARSDGISHYDGHTWSAPYPARSVTRVWAIAPNDAWATSGWTYRGITTYWHWDGAAWEARNQPASPETWMFPTHADYGLFSNNSFAFGPHDVWSVVNQEAIVRRRVAPN
jgi:hypothetical protein